MFSVELGFVSSCGSKRYFWEWILYIKDLALLLPPVFKTELGGEGRLSKAFLLLTTALIYITLASAGV